MEVETRKIVENQGLHAKTERRETARIGRTKHEKSYKSVQNPCSRPASICCPSSVAERVLGKDEVVGSIPTGSTIPAKTTDRGAMSEAMVAAKLIRLGASIFTPAFGHDHPFDMIVHWSGNLSRIQVKTARDSEDGACILINGQGVVDRVGGKQYPVITADDCDVIVGYHIETDTAYVIRPVGKTRYQLRRTPPKNGQIIGIMYQSDYRLVHLDQVASKNRYLSPHPSR